jgi:regulator of protease activity HflC (stomatin/prohibitin superfamily)
MKQFRFSLWHIFILFMLISIFGWRIIPFLIVFFALAYFVFPLLREKYEEQQGGEFPNQEIFNVPEKKTGKKTTKQSFSIPKMTFPMKSIFSFRNIALFIGALLIIIIIIDGLVSVPAGHVAVIYDRGRGVLSEEMPEGLHLKIPFWQVATIMDTRLRVYTMSIEPSEGDLYGDDSIEALTRDGQKVNVDVTVQYHILADNAPKIFQTKGDDREYPMKIVRPGVRSVIRDVVTGYDSTKLFTLETRTEVTNEMESRLKELYEKDLVTLDKLLLRNIRFSDQYLGSIEEKQIAQQKIQKAEYQRQEAEKLKEKKIIEAQAEAEAVRLKGEMLQRYPNVIQFEFVQKMADDVKWGFLPSGSVPLLDLGNLDLR